MLRVKYLGHACFTVSDGTKNIIIDPFLTGNPAAAASPTDIRVDAVLITHGHKDHLGDGIEIAKKNDALVIGVAELAGYCSSQGCRVHPMQIGGSHEFDFGRVKLTAAIHGSGLPQEDGSSIYLGLACGFVVTMGDRTFYHAGDTALFGDMKLIGEMNDLNLALLPIGDNFTMGIEDAVVAAKWSYAVHVIPMHYNTFDTIKADAEEFDRRLAEEKINCRVLKPGEEFQVP